MLTKQEEKLRGKSIIDMSVAELKLWIHACDKMENSVKFNKARRSWTSSRAAAKTELKKREQNSLI